MKANSDRAGPYWLRAPIPPMRSRHCGHDRQRSVAAGHPERIRAGRHAFMSQRGQVLARGEDDGLDPCFPRPLGPPGARPCRHPTSG